ncbi:PAS domain S-box protein [Dictyobacter aurantiacus]|uniref:histidine kinase n=1 Tax=Dictyobacter aurantiacus TaxID=1936993 RepID=A0A401ZMX1_9CHLR|nr:PAS domain S-box protein [Dictyobacter aurantiacus]GCE08174.1 hypothetical protein KDAU_55030 [Dictyobacter aurantiacus]
MVKRPDPAPQEEVNTISQLRSEVRKNARRFQATFEQAAVGMAHVSLDGRWLQVNQQLCDALGYSREELQNFTIQQVTYREDLADSTQAFQQLLTGEMDTYRGEKRYIRKDGQLTWMHITASLARDEDGEPLYLIVVIQQIDERKKIEEALYRQQQAFQTLAENARDVIGRFDRDFRYIYVNPVATRITGIPRADFIGKTHAEIGLSPRYAEIWQNGLRKVFETRQPAEIEIKYDSDTGPLYYQASLSPEFDAAGNTVSVLSIARDITEQKRIEEERARLLKQEQRARAEAEAERVRLHNFLMQVPAMVCLLNGPEHRYEFANGLYMQIIGNRDLIGKTVREALPDLADQGFYELLDNVYQTGEPFIGNEIPVLIDRNLNGHKEEAYFNFIYQPTRNVDGDIDGIMVHAVEVTEMIRNRKFTRSSQWRLEMAQQAAQIGTFEWLVPTNDIIWTPELEALYGLPAGGFEGKYENWVQRVHPDDIERATSNLQRSIEGGPSYNAEFRIIRPDGSIRWMLGKGETQYDEHGQALRVVGVNIDITERKETELQLARTLEQVGFIAATSKLLVASIDYRDVLAHVIKNAIPAIADWCRIDLHNDRADMQPQSISYPDPVRGTSELSFEELSRVVDADATPSILNTVRQQKKSDLIPRLGRDSYATLTSDASEQKMLRSLRAVSAMVVPLMIEDAIEGTVILVASAERGPYSRADLNIAEELASRVSMAVERARIYQNMQELNANLEARVAQRTEELRQLNADLERSNQELQEFAYVASHDLQEPLRKIQAFGNLLEDEYGEQLDDGKEYLDRMRNAAGRMRVLIDDLLTFSRVATKTMPFTPTDLNMIARDVIDDLEARIQETHGTIEVEELPTIDADSRQIYQVLQNLLGNALKFHRPDVPPVIKVAATIQEADTDNEFNTGPTCVLTVQDNGIGFDEKYLDRIFTVFQRLHGRTEYEGTGIGLAVVRKIVERHGGTITATSTIGEGSTFIVTLPVNHQTKETENLYE